MIASELTRERFIQTIATAEIFTSSEEPIQRAPIHVVLGMLL